MAQLCVNGAGLWPWLLLVLLLGLLAAGFAAGAGWLALRQGHRGTGCAHARSGVLRSVMGRLCHDVNNQLGILSNGASVLQRRTDEPQLRRLIDAMGRAVTSASAVSQGLQRLATVPAPRAQAFDLALCLHTLEPAFAAVLGRYLPLRVAVGPEPQPVQVDQDAMELALLGLLVHVKDTAKGQAQVTLASHRRPADAARGPRRFEVEVRITVQPEASETDVSADPRFDDNEQQVIQGLDPLQCLFKAAGATVSVLPQGGGARVYVVRLPGLP